MLTAEQIESCVNTIDEREAVLRHAEMCSEQANQSYAVAALAREHGGPDEAAALPWLIEGGLFPGAH